MLKKVIQQMKFIKKKIIWILIILFIWFIINFLYEKNISLFYSRYFQIIDSCSIDDTNSLKIINSNKISESLSNSLTNHTVSSEINSKIKHESSIESKYFSIAKFDLPSYNLTLKKNEIPLNIEIVSIDGSSDKIVNFKNPHPFAYVINSPKLCRNSTELDVIAYVHTSPTNYNKRRFIRSTWGNISHYGSKFAIAFFMGVKINQPQTQKAIEAEQLLYHDIVQEDFHDHYHNLTYKGVAALKWISTYCPHAKYVLKTDDDILVNSFRLFKTLKQLYEIESNIKDNKINLNQSSIQEKDESINLNQSSIKVKDELINLNRNSIRSTDVNQFKNMKNPTMTYTISCYKWDVMPVLRSGKWKVLESDFPNDTYPRYCSGSAFVLPIELVKPLLKVSYTVPFFWVDDVYITGLLPQALGNVTFHHLNGYFFSDTKSNELLEGYFLHYSNREKANKLWKKILEQNR